MGLLARGEDVGHGANVLQTQAGGMLTQFVYGASCAMMVATRDDGYHSRPHRHRAEQINFVIAGEIWVFVEHQGFLARQGDFYRIPANAVHWGWNLGGQRVTTAQAFAPPVDPYTRKNTVDLFDMSESRTLTDHCATEYIEDESGYMEFESKFFESLESGRDLNE